VSRPHHPFDAGAGESAKPLLERPSFLITVGLIALVAGAIVTLAVTKNPKPEPVVSTMTPPVGNAQPTPPSQPAADPSLTQRRDLSEFLSPEEYARFMGDIEAGKTQGSVSLDSGQPAEPGKIGPTQNPSIPNPEPWQYDPVNDKHYHPEHGHWHQGKPPTVRDRTPEPWEYDPATNKHWHPGHNHWHDGPPPPPEERDGAPMADEG
jgi:hypothetical protein